MIGAPVTVWPGCGIAFFVDVMRMPENAFGYVPTPAPVAPIEFTLGADDDEALGGHMASVKRLDDVVAADRDHLRLTDWRSDNPRPTPPKGQARASRLGPARMRGAAFRCRSLGTRERTVRRR